MTDFYGFDTATLESTHLRLEYLTHAEPCIVRLFLSGYEQNLLGEIPDIGWDTPNGFYKPLGGHRLWAAPEVEGVSYTPNDRRLDLQEMKSGVKITSGPGTGPGLERCLQIQLAEESAKIQICHKIVNGFDHPLRISPWGITVLPLGGIAYLPCPPIRTDYQPDRSLVIWPYASWGDPRLKLDPAGIIVKAEAFMPPLKIGTFASNGLCAYLREDLLLVKRLKVMDGEYPDRNCNFEVYCSDRLIEIETLAPLKELQPGDYVESNETWEIYTAEKGKQMLQEIFSAGEY